jgi:hypothetical protein
MKIFRDCISVIKISKRKYNPSNLVLPTLFSQIDGILKDYMIQEKLLYVVINKRSVLVDGNKNRIEWKKWYTNQTKNLTILNSANDILLNILFQKAYTSEALQDNFTFSRHKVLHGEFLHYGRMDNTIRAFLILDFLAILSAKQQKDYF